MNGAGPSDAQRRLLAVVAQRVPPERVRELYLFAPMRQGGVETGLAVIAAGEPESLPEEHGAPVAEPTALDERTGAGPGGDGEPLHLLSSDADVVRAVVLAAEAAVAPGMDADAACDPTDDAAGGWPPTGGPAGDGDEHADAVAPHDEPAGRGMPGATESPPEPVAEDAAGRDDQGGSPRDEIPGESAAAAPDAGAAPAPADAPARFTIYTARYRLQLKGPERGKWEAEVVAEADAPLLTVDAVVRGVQRRAGEVAEVERLTTADVRRLLAEGV